MTVSELTVPIPLGYPTFLDVPRCNDLDALDADIALIGVPYTEPYDMPASRQVSSSAPEAIREQSLRLASRLSHYDYDFKGPIFAGRDVRIVDCGDVAMMPGAYEDNFLNVTSVMNAILDRGATPIILGGDHAVPNPVLPAYENRGPLHLVQIDAHIDWRDERNGVRQGLSSPMRRASEMPWVSGMSQIGIRGTGSARQQEFDDAAAYGALIVGADELHEMGVNAVLGEIPDVDQYYITLDADGLDPSIAPGVRSTSFGGVTYYEATKLLRGIAAKGNVVGFDFVEVVPNLDVANTTSFLAARLILNMLGALAHNGRIGVEAGAFDAGQFERQSRIHDHARFR